MIVVINSHILIGHLKFSAVISEAENVPLGEKLSAYKSGESVHLAIENA